nr:MAG TPA: putative nuclease of the RNAse H fold, HicB family [Caudoviricetes sp.]
MNNNIIKYKGYFTQLKVSIDDNVLYGKIEGINDLVTFECETVQEAESAFREAVDDYLIFCEENGLEPDKTYKGSFNVRVSPELHRSLAMQALKENKSLNSLIESVLEDYIVTVFENDNDDRCLHSDESYGNVFTDVKVTDSVYEKKMKSDVYEKYSGNIVTIDEFRKQEIKEM